MQLPLKRSRQALDIGPHRICNYRGIETADAPSPSVEEGFAVIGVRLNVQEALLMPF
ncbi:MAG: hypothetical protein ACT6QU_02280 [Aliihoeflea sp.]|uniref:hypothetical protein n=1 Tax=Aliihoeflea sp. TaxID=2608088 RepID=UPI0040336CCF